MGAILTSNRVFLITVFAAALVMCSPHLLADAGSAKDSGDRIKHNGERDRNRGDDKGAHEAKDAADRARNSKDADKARQIERDYNKGSSGGGSGGANRGPASK